MPRQQVVMSAFHLLALWASAVGIARAQQPWNIVFNGSAGPDGPWNVIPLPVDFPAETISVYPGLTGQNFWVFKQACPPHGNRCPLPIPGLWDQNAADTGTSQNLFNDLNSPDSSPTTWSSDFADLMNLTGDGYLASVRVVLEPSSIQNDSTTYYLDSVPSWLSYNASSAYPGGIAYSYTPDFGLLDLAAPGGTAQNTTTWKNSTGATTVTNSTLYKAYADGAINSVSFGLHIGSALSSATIPGSLYLGGYDSVRVLSPPVVNTFSNSLSSVNVQLVDIALGIVNGTSPFANVSSGSIPGLLQSSTGVAAGPQSVTPDPGVPYLYLPGATCDAIARNLPLTYSPDLNLYLWNTSSPTYTPLIASNTFLSFIFNSGTSTGNVTINAPLALLSLSLQYPVANISTPYFPCRPYDEPASYPTVVGAPTQRSSATTDSRKDGSRWAGYRLGRAFLQAAFLGINWQSNTLWLAQAPGPQLPQSSPAPVALHGNDQSITPLLRAPSWAETWADTLGAFEGPPYTPQTVTSTTVPTEPFATNDNGGLSSRAIGGIIAGAVIGGLVLGALLAVFITRRRRQAKQRDVHDDGAGIPHHGEKTEYYGYSADYKRAPVTDDNEYEADGTTSRHEVAGDERHELAAGHGQVHEMPASEYQAFRRTRSHRTEDETEAQTEIEASSPMLGANEDRTDHAH